MEGGEGMMVANIPGAHVAHVAGSTGLAKRFAWALAILSCLAVALAFAVHAPYAAYAQDGQRETVRVGWYNSPFNQTDAFDRRTGYAYEYERKIAAYTGWSYEYVEGSWSELLQMLQDGEIDLMSDVSYVEERAKSMHFGSLPMGTESYYVFVSPGNDQISAADYSALNGKRVGVVKDSVQKELFLSWAGMHGIEVDLVEVTVATDEALQQMNEGKLDAFVTMDVYGDPDVAIPICKVGSSDFYFVVNKDRTDLLHDLDVAMNRIQDENKYYNQQLHEKYLSSAGTDSYLTPDEEAWLSQHKAIRVGYQDNYLAFCASDPSTGELTGALGDYLHDASTALENAYIEFEPHAYPTAAAAMEALVNGEVDCMFPANLIDYDGEQLGVVMTPPLMRTEMDAVVRAADQKEFLRKPDVTVAVNEGNTNYDMWLMDNYPTWERAYFKDTPTGLEAVAAGGADCVIISNYRFSNISKQCERLHLTTVYTGVDMDYSFAVREGDGELYSILSRVVGAVPSATISTALTYYSTEDVKTSFADLVKDNLFIIMSVIAAILLVILVLLLRGIRAEKRAREEAHVIKDLNERVFVDALTSVRNKGAFDNYVRDLQERIDGGEKLELAIGVFDCDNLKEVNDQHGHDKGDVYLRASSALICRVFKHSPVFRIGGDEFAVVLQNDDFKNRDALVAEFKDAQDAINADAANPWDEVHLAQGIAVFDASVDASVSDVVRRADKIMYENKRLGKMRRS